MHFRQLIISGFIAGAAMLLPTLAFAEKGPDGGKPELQKTAVQSSLPPKSKNANTSGKGVSKPAVEKPAKEKNVQGNPVAIPSQPAKSKGEVQSSLKKSENATKIPLPKDPKASKRDQAKKIAKPGNPKGKQAAVKSIHSDSENVKVIKRVSPGLKDQVEAYQEHNEKRVLMKKPAPKVTVQKNVTQEESKDSSEKRYPKGDTSPAVPSRTNGLAGPSSDRTSNGNTSISFSDKWFVWDHYFYLITSKSFTSRVIVYRSQWINAPPSPPPVEAPVFIPYTDAIRHG